MTTPERTWLTTQEFEREMSSVSVQNEHEVWLIKSVAEREMHEAIAKAAETLIWASGAFDTDEKSAAWVKVGAPALGELLKIAATPPDGISARKELDEARAEASRQYDARLAVEARATVAEAELAQARAENARLRGALGEIHRAVMSVAESDRADEILGCLDEVSGIVDEVLPALADAATPVGGRPIRKVGQFYEAAAPLGDCPACGADGLRVNPNSGRIDCEQCLAAFPAIRVDAAPEASNG